jgi:hypothetical protein
VRAPSTKGENFEMFNLKSKILFFPPIGYIDAFDLQGDNVFYDDFGFS